jgi:hypothetical protein
MVALSRIFVANVIADLGLNNRREQGMDREHQHPN